MNVWEYTWLIVLAFACQTLSKAALIWLRRHNASKDKHRKADCFAVPAHDLVPDDTPHKPNLQRTLPTIETSFDGDKRIGAI